MTRAEMLERMSSRELSEWLAFYSIEPFGGETPYIGPAITSMTLANINRKKGSKPLKVDEFIPKWEVKKQTASEQLQFAETLTIALGGKDLRPEQPIDDEDE
jgi:hypothetical protein